MDRRADRRRRTRDEVPIAIGASLLRCTIRNLSPTGCLVECRGLPAEIGAPVLLTLMDDLHVMGEIAWQMGDSSGIRFHRPIAASVVRWYALDDWPLRPPMPGGAPCPPE